jgi:MoaA/NifB/PqqE/SkfB family radical SAM enzyme
VGGTLGGAWGDIVFEATARCNLDCRHCSINLSARDRAARRRELGAAEIGRIAGEAAALGAAGCLLTGGEPLFRNDFFDVYRALLGKGLFLSLFTNATLVTAEHVRFLRKYPPRVIDVTAHGLTREAYERVTRTPKSFDAFKRGLSRLVAGGLAVRLRVTAIRSNKHEVPAIGEFCRVWGMERYRIDAKLHLRLDGNESRNTYIRAERLDDREIARLERSDPHHCGAGLETSAEVRRSFVVGPDGRLRPWSALVHPDFLFDLRKVSLAEALDRASGPAPD